MLTGSSARGSNFFLILPNQCESRSSSSKIESQRQGCQAGHIFSQIFSCKWLHLGLVGCKKNLLSCCGYARPGVRLNLRGWLGHNNGFPGPGNPAPRSPQGKREEGENPTSYLFSSQGIFFQLATPANPKKTWLERGREREKEKFLHEKSFFCLFLLLPSPYRFCPNERKKFSLPPASACPTKLLPPLSLS